MRFTPISNQGFFLALLLSFLLMLTFPYLVAWRAGGDEFVFGGFLLNPLDGNSYLAKMYQGLEGNWKSTLPYTAEPGDGVYLFTYYLFLGHLARWFNLPLVLVFHLARLGGAVLLAHALWIFFGRVFARRSSRYFGFALAVFGSGLGWIASLFGAFTSDLWVAEAFPFLSSFSNPHFPLGLALMIWTLMPVENPAVAGKGYFPGKYNWRRFLFQSIVRAILLGVIMPFGIVIAGVVLAGISVWELGDLLILQKKRVGEWVRQSSSALQLISLIIGGLPILIYDLWVSTAHPVFSAWNQQNLTQSPAVWDLLISIGPAAVFAIPGAIWVWRNPKSEYTRLFVWAGLGLLLLYLPFGLQRRFMLGVFIPLVGLAFVGLEALTNDSQRRRFVLIALFMTLSLPTNLLILTAAIQGSLSREPLLYLSRNEFEAVTWLRENSKPGALVLASPETGMFIPAQTGRRVFYGHPFETVNAEQMKAAVEEEFRGGPRGNQGLMEIADFVFFGPRERSLGIDQFFDNLPVAFQSGEVKIYQVDQPNPAIR